MIDDPVGAKQVLNRLAALGMQIAVDDFGTGYTSMAQLESLPLRTLKIDRSFVWRMLDDPGGAVLVKAIIDLAHEFNLVVVAEGVEQESMIVELRRLGCDIAQGYHWSEAGPRRRGPRRPRPHLRRPRTRERARRPDLTTVAILRLSRETVRRTPHVATLALPRVGRARRRYSLRRDRPPAHPRVPRARPCVPARPRRGRVRRRPARRGRGPATHLLRRVRRAARRAEGRSAARSRRPRARRRPRCSRAPRSSRPPSRPPRRRARPRSASRPGSCSRSTTSSRTVSPRAARRTSSCSRPSARRATSPPRASRPATTSRSARRSRRSTSNGPRRCPARASST